MSFRRPDRKRKTRPQPRRASFVRSLNPLYPAFERRRLMSIEPLETRTLLAANPLTLDLSAEAQGQAVTLGLDATHTNLVLTVSPDSAQNQTIPLANVSQVTVIGSTFNDVVTVDSTNGAVTVPISFDGRGGSDSLVLRGGTATSDIYTAGPLPGQGTDALVIGGKTESVSFSNLAPVFDSVAGPAVVTGTSGNDAISYTEGNNTSGTPSTAWGQVSVNNQEAFNFTNKTTLTINTGLGTDTVNLNNPNKPTGLTGITVNGGNASAGDTLTVNGTTASNSINFSPTSLTAATITGAGPVAISATGIGQTAINGQGGFDALAIISPGPSQLAFTPGPTLDSGSLTMQALFVGGTYMPVSFSNLGTFGSVSVSDVSGTRVDGLNVYGTNADNQFNVSTGGVVQVVNPASLIPRTLPIATPGITQLNLIGQGGNETFNVPGNDPFASGIAIQGNPAGNNTVNFKGDGAAAITVNLAAATVDEAGFQPVTLSGISTLNVNAGGAALTVVDSNANTNLAVTPTGLQSGTVQANGTGTLVNFVSAAISGLTVSLPGGGNTLTVNGSAGDDTITVTNGTAGIAGNINTNYTPADLAALDINGLAGDDMLVVNSAAGAVVTPIVYDGGAGTNALSLVGGGATSDVYTPGPLSGQGTDMLVIGGKTESVQFTNLTPVFDSVTGPLTVNGTNGNDAINYAEGNDTTGTANTAWGQVSVNNAEPINFTGKTTLTINSLAGNDTANLNNPNTPTGLTTVAVNGGDPTASDTLIVNGRVNIADTITYTPATTTSDTGSVAITGLPTVNFAATEHLVINGQNGGPGGAGDSLTINTSNLSSNQTEILTPGSTFDSGHVDFRDRPGGVNPTAVPLDFSGLGVAGSLTFTDVGRFDNLIYNGTPLNDTFSVNASGQVVLNDQIPVSTPSIRTITLAGLGGNDTFNIAGNHNLPGNGGVAGVVVEGSDPASNVLNFTGDGTGAVAVDLAAQTVTEAGFAPVSFTGVAKVNVNAGGKAVTVDGTAQNDSFSYTPQTATEGLVQLTSSSTLVDVSNVGGAGLTLDALGGNNAITVNGTSNNDSITTTLGATTTVAVNSLLPINLPTTDTQSLVLAGGAGNDTYSFTATGGPASVTVVGGSGTNALVLPGAAGNDSYTIGAGSDSSSGTASYILPAGASPSIAFSGLKNIGVAGDGGAGSDSLTLNGTGGNDTFNLKGTATSAGTVQVNGGPLVTFLSLGTGAGTTINLNGAGGADTFNVTQPGSWRVASVTVTGGTPGAGGNLLLNAEGAAGTDAFTYSSTGPQSGTVGLNSGGSATAYVLTNIATLGLNELGPAAASLSVTNANAVITPATTPNSGTVTTTDTANSTALLPLTYTNIATVTASGTSAVINAPDDGDSVTISAAGLVTVTNKLGVSNTIDASGYTKLSIDLLGANDTLTVAGDSSLFTGGVTVVGGESGYTVTAPVGANSTLDLATNSVSGIFGGNLSLVGIGNLVLNGAATAMTVANYGAPSTLASVTLNGDATIAVATSGTLNTYDFTSQSPSKAQLALAGGGPTINITGFNNTPGNLTLTGSAVNALDVIGSSGTNVFNVSVAGGLTQVLQTTGGVWVPLDFTGFKSLSIGGGNSDSLTVDSSNGAVTTPIFFNGGSGANSLTLNDTVHTNVGDTYTPGPQPGQGVDRLDFGGGVLETVAFTNLTPVFDNIAGPLTVNGTTGNDAITAGATANVVSVNNLESITFANKTGLTLNGNGGTDTFNISPANITLTAAGAITVAGAAGAVDSLTVNGNLTTGYTPNLAVLGAGNITTAGNPAIAFTNVTSANIVGDGAGDTLTLGNAGNLFAQFTAGATADSGSLTMQVGYNGPSVTPLSFSNLGFSGGLSVLGGGFGSLDINGTNLASNFNLSSAGVVQLFKPLGAVPETVPITTTDAAVRFIGHSGSDTFNVPGNHPFAFGLEVEGATGNNTLNFTGDGTAAVTVNLGPGAVDETGFGTVTYLGVATVNVNAGGNTLSVNGTAGNDTLAVTPTGANGVSFQAYSGGTAQNGQGGTLASLTPIGPAFNATSVSGAAGGFSINGNGGSDMLFVEGTQNGDTIDVDDAASGANAVKVGGALIVNYNAAMAQVEVDALAGSDTINIAPSATTGFLVDGGDPIGVQPGDTINLIHPPGPFQIFAGPTSDSGGLKTAGFQTVSWVHIETVANTGGGAPIITGTNGNDEITVIARDSSYNPANPGVPNPLLDGVQDFTVSVNGGPDMLFINTPDLFIDSLSGNDDIVVREPAPNQAAWNVQVFVAAGAPASGDNRLGDNIELETPGTQTVTYTPNSPLSAVPPVAGVTFASPNAGGGQFSDAANTSTITATQFLIPGVYDSSPGGAENFIYAGEAGNDTLIYNTPANANAGSNLVYTPGARPDSGTIAGSQNGGAALTPLTFSGLGTTGGLSFTTSNAGRTDHLNVEGVPTSAGESFSVTPANGGTVQLAQLPPASGIVTVPILTSSVSALELDGLGGNDVFNLAAGLPYTDTIIDDGAVVNLTGAAGAVTVNLADPASATNTTITGYGGTVTLTDVDTANLDAGTNPVSVNGSAANDNLAVTPTGANSAAAQDNGTGTVFNFSNAASFTTDLMGGTNTVIVNGTNGSDTIGVVRGAVTTTVSVNALLPVNVTTADTAALTVATGLGSDTINVSGGGGPALTVLGGQTPASDILNVTNTAAGTTTYLPGATNDSGTLSNGDGTISFGGIRSVFDTAGTATDTLLVFGTNGDDTISAAHVGPFNVAWVNAQVPIVFTGFGTLNLNGRFGNDSFVVSPVGLTGLTAINVTGNAGANNTVTVNGSAAADAITYSPTGAGAGTVAITGSATVGLANMASLILNGQGGNDALTVAGTAAGNDTFIHTPGAANDAGTIQVNSLLAVAYQNLGSGGSLNVNEIGGGTNTLVVNGTSANDTFGVAGATGTVTLNSRLPIAETGIQSLQLNGLAGSDTFTLNATMPYTNVAINGGNTANNDAVLLNGATGAISVNLANQSATPPTLTTITGYGGTVSLSNIAQASINGSGADTLTLTGTPNDDQINYQPTSASGGNFSLAALNTAFSFNIGSSPANTFVIFGGGNTGGDQVNVRGPNAGSTFIVVEQTGVVTVSNAAGTNLMPVILGTNVQTVELDAGVGNNTFLVDPAPGLLLPGKTDVVGQPNFVVPNNLLVNVVGGGAASQNALIIAAYNPANGQSSTLDPSLFAVVNRTSNTDGVVRVFHSNGPAPANEPNQFPDISYAGIGTVSANTATNAATHQQQTLTMGPDLYDPNGSLNNAAYLGSGATINATNLAIFPNAFEHRFLQAEQDWFRVVAQSTGTMDFQIYFNQYAGFLPGNGELQIQVYDSAGNQIADFGVNDQTSDQRRRIPVVAGETYYLQVYGVSQDPTKFPQNPAAPDVFDPNNATVNAYSISIINTPAPTPDALGLNNVVAQGTVNNTIAPTTTTFAANNAPVPPPVIPPNFQTQPLPPLSSLNNFYVGMYLEFTSGALIGQRQLVSGYVAATHTFTFASAFSAAPAAGDTFQIESDDTGRSQLDNVTRDNTPTIYIRLDAANTPNDGLIDLQGGGNSSQTPPNNVPIPIPFWAGNAPTAPNSPANNGSFRVAVYDETDPKSPIFLGYANAVAGETGVFQLQVATPMSDGTHTIVAKVEMDSPSTPSNHDVGSGVSLQIVVDTQAPPVYFGSPTVPKSGLQGASDTGVAGQPATIADRITADSTPTFYGVAEANAIVKLYVDMNSDGKVDNGDIFIGQTVATPLDGTNQDPSGQWTLTSSIDLNNPKFGFSHDGVRTILATAEDVAGNISAAQTLTIFLDTQGPQVGNVTVTGNPGYNLFANKPNQPTPTPLINAIDVTFTDQPVRVGPDFVYPAVNPTLATTIANYQLVGKYNGVIPITSVTFVDSTASGTPGMSVATLHFAAPLPDDYYTLTISDKIEDNAGNPLDGEFNGTTFPSGNNSPGGPFGGSFVVNSHPHVAVYSNGSVSLDINGNGVFDPSNTVTDSDLVETFGYPSDRLFAGNFASPSGFVSGFDELGAYGFLNGQWRWLLNLAPAQGTSNPTTFIEPYSIDGLPVAGYFAGNKALGMQVGLFDGTNWWLDVLNHHTIDQADVAAGGKLTGDMKGIPIVGDFDGDGKVDLATYQNGVFEFDLSSKEPGGKVTGNFNATIDVQSLIPNNIGFSGVMARPVAADIDQDGITDLGLYVPGQTENAPYGVAEWFWLVSNDTKDAGGVNPAGAFASLNHPFNPTPLGHDLFYRYGNQFALPIVGIWDPPVSASTTTSDPSSNGWIDSLYQNALGRQPSTTEATNWDNTIASGQMTQAQVAQTFIESSERLGAIINSYYQQYLGRSADQAGVNYWIGVWQAHGGPEQVQAGIIGSPEYYATAGKLHPSLSPDAAWVTALYNNLLGRTPDAQGLAYWVSYIQTNSRQSVVLGFVTSAEYRLGLINGWFEEYLGRPADASGAQYWLAQMEQGMTQDEVQIALLTSDEFKAAH
ncbi:MAG TPA: DUF4214 domain-containing protein [Pirellulales bacterium]|nr:DUF4214 domain-containing protein [Pirellulales bacterium]